VKRFRESSHRPQAFQLLGAAVQQMFKVLDMYSDKVVFTALQSHCVIN